MTEIIIHQDWYQDKIDEAVSALMRLDRLEQTGFTGSQEGLDCMRDDMWRGIDSLIDERDSVRARALQARQLP